MGDSGDRKRSKKSKRSKRAKASKKARLAKEAKQARRARLEDQSGDESVLSEASQTVVIELQRTELSRLLREQQRLNDRVDQLLRLHEREQVLRQQMQAALDKLAAQRTLPAPEPVETDNRLLIERADRAEGKFAALRSAVVLLIDTLERRTATAQ